MHHWMTYSSLSYNTIQFKHDYSMYTGAQFVDGGGEGRLKHKLDCLINLHQLAGERWGCVKIATAKICLHGYFDLPSHQFEDKSVWSAVLRLGRAVFRPFYSCIIIPLVHCRKPQLVFLAVFFFFFFVIGAYPEKLRLCKLLVVTKLSEIE